MDEESSWSPTSWKYRPAEQAIEYPHPYELEKICSQLRQLPPLVRPYEIELCRKQLYDAAIGRAFIVQGGDCAESFHDVQHGIIRKHVELLHEQSQTLALALGKPVVCIGRIAGQYAKPRSKLVEELPSGRTVTAFRGHNVNGPDVHDRTPDPQRLLLGYLYASATLHTVSQVQRDIVESQPGQYTSSLYTSHEVLHLPYESSLTHGEYNTSATFVWLGERTRQLDGAHVEYARGLRNPVGVKIGPQTTPAAVVALLNVLCPDQAQYGKITLITRLGADRVHSVLPQIIRAVQLSGHVPLWLCDPCHGNTVSTPSGKKTRHFDTMLRELQETYTAHRRLGSHLGGLHLEQTGEEVTECLDPLHVTHSDDLDTRYRSLCDPRLSRRQAIDLVQHFSTFVLNHL